MRFFAVIGLLCCILAITLALMYAGWSLAVQDLKTHRLPACVKVLTR